LAVYTAKKCQVTGGRDGGEQHLPEEGQEVHDVVAAGRHLLLGLALAFALAFSFFFIVVSWGQFLRGYLFIRKSYFVSH
jgi:hypothetical protein